MMKVLTYELRTAVFQGSSNIHGAHYPGRPKRVCGCKLIGIVDEAEVGAKIGFRALETPKLMGSDFRTKLLSMDDGMLQ